MPYNTFPGLIRTENINLVYPSKPYEEIEFK